MQRRTFLRNASLAAGTMALGSQKLLAGFRPDDPWKMKILRNNVGIFIEKGGTIAYLSDSEDGSLVVDAQFPEQASHFISQIKRYSDSPFRMLVNTHHHVDHTAGNISFNNNVKNIVAHENSKASQVRVAKEKNNEDKQLYPDITFSDTWRFKIGHESVRAYYWGAAHTNGDSIIHFEHANIVHMGDLVFYNIYPLFDKAAGSSGTNWINVLDKTVNTFDKDTIFVFGHEHYTGGWNCFCQV